MSWAPKNPRGRGPGGGWVSAVLAAALCVAVGCGRGRERPNIVLISIDTLRPDHLSAYGYDRPTSPFLSSLAASGVRFDNCYSVTSWTRPSMASLFTGFYPRSHGVYTTDLIDPDGTRWPVKIDPSFTTLAESLKAAGYRTFGVTANPQAGVWAGGDQGFDTFVETGDSVTADRVHELALTLRDKLASARPYFLWVFYYDPHAPYHARRPWAADYEKDEALLNDPLLAENHMDGDWTGATSVHGDPRRLAALQALYDSEINYVDGYIRRLFEEVVPPGSDPLVIVHADHGEEFLEHGLLGHGRSLFLPSVRIPLIIKDPGGRWSGKVVSQPACIIDIYPTILDYLGLTIPDSLQGTSLLPWAEGEKSVRSRELICELEEEESPHLQGLLAWPWRFIRRVGGEEGPWLFEEVDDAGERNNRAVSDPSRVKTLSRKLEKWLAATPRFLYNLREKRWSEEARDRLRALGYLN